jgi:hypothetical protein
LRIAEDHQNSSNFYNELYNLVEIGQFPQDDVLQRVESYTGDEILPTKETVLEELNKRVVYHGKENQNHRQLLDIIIHLPEEQQNNSKIRFKWWKHQLRIMSNLIISVNSSTTASFDTQ